MQYAWPRPEISTAAMTSVSSIGMVTSAKTRDARLIAKSLRERLAQHNAHIFNRMMGIDFDVALRMHRQIEQTVATEALSI